MERILETKFLAAAKDGDRLKVVNDVLYIVNENFPLRWFNPHSQSIEEVDMTDVPPGFAILLIS